MTYKEEFITFMVRSGVLTFGDFTTKSGRKTPYFVNTGNYKTGAQAAKLGDYYAACIQEHMPDIPRSFSPRLTFTGPSSRRNLRISPAILGTA